LSRHPALLRTRAIKRHTPAQKQAILFSLSRYSLLSYVRSILSLPSRYGRNAPGTVTVPSSFW
jgi:hypothetical protein